MEILAGEVNGLVLKHDIVCMFGNGELNGAWYRRTNGQRFHLELSGHEERATLAWREEVAVNSTNQTLALFFKTLADDLAERVFEWSMAKRVKEKSNE